MASMDMSLDDMIKSRRSTERGRVRRGRGSGRSVRGGRLTEPPRRGPLGVNRQSSAYSIAKSFRRIKGLPWQHDLFEDSLRAAGLSGLESSTKLYISNLDVGVTNEDIRELFSEIGELKRYALHYDKNGCPSGFAEVLFVRRSDAFRALKRYNNVQLDGKPMKIEIVGAKSEVPVSACVNVVVVNGRKRSVLTTPGGKGPVRTRGAAAVANRSSGQTTHRGSNSGPRRGQGRGGWGGGRGGGGRKKAIEKSAD